MVGSGTIAKGVGKVVSTAFKVEKAGNKIADLNGIADINGGSELVEKIGSGIQKLSERAKNEVHQLPTEMDKYGSDILDVTEMSFEENHSTKEIANIEVGLLQDEMPFSTEESKITGDESKGIEENDNLQEKNEDDNAEKTQMEPSVTVEFTCKDKYDKAEYERQIKNQEKGMNNISLYDYLKNRESYRENGRNLEVGQPAQEKARQEARADRVAENRRKGMSREEAETEADEWLDTQAALHDPDQIAGGDAANVTGMGDKEINSSIGSQWQYRIGDVDAAVQKYIEDNNLSEEDLKNVYLNVNLEVVSE